MKKHNITLSLALAAIFSASTVFAEAEVTGKIVHESASFTDSGTTIGAASSHGSDVFKTETSARIYIDGEADELSDGATYHVEVQAFTDSQGVGDFDSNESYTQRDALREAYLDMQQGDWSIRAGKQQVVWGTADGMKLLDAINPTDYSEMAQNQMEDSRIPVWMINAETTLPTGGDMQMIISEGKSSHFAGMGNESTTARGAITLNGAATQTSYTPHTNSDRGQAFVMKGADTITGVSNGFLNAAAALGVVAQAFDQGAIGGGGNYVSLAGYTKASVNDFAINLQTGTNQSAGFVGFCDNSKTDAACLANVANSHTTPLGYKGANIQSKQNLLDSGTVLEWDAATTNSTNMFHYMKDATFATFDAFVNMKTKYVVSHNSDPTLAWRLKDSTKDGVNWSFNVTHGNDTNPYVDMAWQNSAGALLTETVGSATAVSKVTSTSATAVMTYYSNYLKLASNPESFGSNVGGAVSAGHTSLASTSVAANAMTATNVAHLVMTEKLNPITQIGGSFDMAIETAALGPVVIRGEALYQKDVMSPIVTRRDSATHKDLDHGFLVEAVKMLPGDRFKYVLGADITAMTNMMVSAQFIQDMNLDYVDSGSSSATDWRYTADMATMSLTNNLNQAEENKEFYSLFLSKPFGASGEHRWNNIYMFEENDGNWNRFDVEFSVNDDTQATLEWNKYWGDENTQFGQLKNSSNIQAGVKYSF
jgi:hypothetical protein